MVPSVSVAAIRDRAESVNPGPLVVRRDPVKFVPCGAGAFRVDVISVDHCIDCDVAIPAGEAVCGDCWALFESEREFWDSRRG